MKKPLNIGILAVAMVWFTTHFGGGFASGRQVIDFFVNYGWFAIFTPIIAVALMAIVNYFAWDHAIVEKTYSYRSWANSFFKPVEKIFANVYEVAYIIILLTATSIAFATGGATLTQVFGTPYILNTVIIAVGIFLLTIFGANVVRSAATVLGIIVVIGMVLIYASNIIFSFPQLKEVMASLPAPKGGAWPAIWKSITYAGFQVCVVGSYIAVAEPLKTHKDVVKTTILGFVLNVVVLMLAATSILSYYPEILPEEVPVIYVISHGFGGNWATYLVSILIFIGVVTTGVNLVYGGVKRFTDLAARRRSSDIKLTRRVEIISSAMYVLITWAIALFGLIPLISIGYGVLGYVGTFAIIIPVIYLGIWRGRAKRKEDKNESKA